MFASLRLLLPKDWSTAHEAAGSWFWHNVEWILQTNIVKPVRYEPALAKLVVTFDDQTKFASSATFFEQCPPGQDFLEQSNGYLHVIASVVIDRTTDCCRTPAKLVDDISALGLRHIDFGILTESMSPS